MNKPSELLDFVINEMKIPLGAICSLHTSCLDPVGCLSHSENKCLVNFDKVKTLYCSNNRQASCKSVDGLGCKNTLLCFVEIKGWKKYFQFRPAANDQQVKSQVETYDFASKFHDSVEICNHIAQNEDFVVNNKCIYVIVTDISVKENPLTALQVNLNSLASTSSSIENICNKYMIPKIKGISGVKTYYKQCSEFDVFWNNI